MKIHRKVHIFHSIQNAHRLSRLSNFHTKLFIIKYLNLKRYEFLIPPFSGERSSTVPLSYAKVTPSVELHLKELK
jgi:hypothetical protein